MHLSVKVAGSITAKLCFNNSKSLSLFVAKIKNWNMIFVLFQFKLQYKCQSEKCQSSFSWIQMKFLLSTNSPDRKHTENIVDEINTALYNREETNNWQLFKVYIFVMIKVYGLHFTMLVRKDLSQGGMGAPKREKNEKMTFKQIFFFFYSNNLKTQYRSLQYIFLRSSIDTSWNLI